MAENWLRTDEIEEFIDALEHCGELATSISEKAARWKWIIIALHNAVQGVCTCALRGVDTAGVTMLTEKSGKAVWHWLDVGSRQNPEPPMPEERLAPMLELYERVKSTKYLKGAHRLPTNNRIDDDVNQLNELRNEFIHFVPRGWSLEVSGMPRIVRTCCDIIEHLSVKHPTFWHHLQNRSERIIAALAVLRDAMDRWERQGAELR